MPGFSSNDPGLSLSFKIRPCHTCGIISCTMTSPRHTTLRTEGDVGPWRKCQNELHLEFLEEVWQTGWTNTHGGYSESCGGSCISVTLKITFLTDGPSNLMWIFLRKWFCLHISVSQNLALLSVAAGHKLRIRDNRCLEYNKSNFMHRRNRTHVFHDI